MKKRAQTHNISSLAPKIDNVSKLVMQNMSNACLESFLREIPQDFQCWVDLGQWQLTWAALKVTTASIWKVLLILSAFLGPHPWSLPRIFKPLQGPESSELLCPLGCLGLLMRHVFLFCALKAFLEQGLECRGYYCFVSQQHGAQCHANTTIEWG